MPSDPVPASTVAAELRDVLARPEFRLGQPHESVFRRILRAIGEFLEDLLGLGPGSAGQVVLWVVVGVLVALIVWLVARLIRDRRAREEGLAAAPAPADPVVVRRERVRDLRRRAMEAERAGDFVLAMRLYFTALVVGLGERGDLEYRDAWTNRELCERGEPSPAVARELTPLAERLERRSFGGEPADPAEVRELARLVDVHLGASSS